VSHAVRLVLVALTVAALLLLVGLFVFRLVREARERRGAEAAARLRAVVFTALLGATGESAAARAELRSRTGRAWAAFEEQAFAMIPKIKGDAREELVTLLLSRGAAARAMANARSRSHVRRARGAYQLGALGQRDAVGALVGLLGDGRFLVRRLAVRSLGQVGDHAAVRPLLDAAEADPELTRDVTVALVRIGLGAAPELRDDLDLSVRTPGHRRRGAIAARALGMLGDVAAVPLLKEVVDEEEAGSLRWAAAGALGEIGVPEVVPALLRALDEDDVRLQVAAGRALGSIGDPAAVPGLARALGEQRTHDAARAVAGALRRIGGDGIAELERSDSPYAYEALALQQVRQGA
jgi:HEAT repeat protein